jgi:hypothetical protein
MSSDAAALLQCLAETMRVSVDESNSLAFVYGSYAYGLTRENSDVDVVVITDGLDPGRQSALINSIVSFHHAWGLALDDEVPFDRKVTATWDDAERAITASFLPRRNGRYYVSPVMKTEEFLQSEEIRLRLLLNAVTGRCIKLLGHSESLEQLQQRARRCWFELLPQLISLPPTWTIADFVDGLIGRPPLDGEMFLGFKSHPVIRNYLVEVFTTGAQACVTSGLLVRDEGRYSYA